MVLGLVRKNLNDLIIVICKHSAIALCRSPHTLLNFIWSINGENVSVNIHSNLTSEQNGDSNKTFYRIKFLDSPKVITALKVNGGFWRKDASRFISEFFVRYKDRNCKEIPLTNMRINKRKINPAASQMYTLDVPIVAHQLDIAPQVWTGEPIVIDLLGCVFEEKTSLQSCKNY